MKPSGREFLKSVSTPVAALAPSSGLGRVVPETPAKALRISDKGNRPPRLRVAHTLWSLIKLPRDGPEWTLEEKFSRVKQAGFEGIEISVEPPKEGHIRRLLDENGLFLGTGFHPHSVEDFRKGLTQAKRLHAEYTTARVPSAFLSDDQAAILIQDGYKVAQDIGVPLLIETHRGTVTENLYRSLRLVARIPEMRLTGDFSHCAVSAEMGGLPAGEQIRLLGLLLDRVDSMHARISNGEQVQVDVGAGDGKLAQTWVEIWAETLRRWRTQAQPGDWFPFSSELGPPPYSIVGLDGKEISDRWEQSLVMKRLIEQAWEKSQTA